ncbi:MAG: hypothetical protein QOD11_1990 [Bradyrhizobium sp.]|jgi:signal transduction histidine kinase|nr:hypothetical protein [Bradyrhizobium sp.]
MDAPSIKQRDTLKFSVDAALLRELGERLVGKAHIALAELVKNSYDADATDVEIKFSKDRIEIVDNGHGMDFEEFKKYWMRIGSPHKQSKIYSRRFKRPVTGSKGVGRLSVQFLASNMTLVSASNRSAEPELEVVVDWREAVAAGDLTEAEANCVRRGRQQTFSNGARHGTRIVLTRLAERWDAEKLQDLAREIWALQPPFAEDLKDDDPHRFRIAIEGEDEELVAPAQQQLQAHLDIWEARLVGRLPSEIESGASKEPAKLRLQFANGESVDAQYSILSTESEYKSTQRTLDTSEFEIRIFKLENKQRFGVRVGEARDYLNKFGGVHIYDAGFHLPYYGADTDWLRVEIDHSHRLTSSDLLPKGLQQPRGLNNLPTNSRIFGVVRVNTSHEREIAGSHSKSDRLSNHLMISVTRDRLIENVAFANLRVFVRWALDFYAIEATKRKLRELEVTRPIEPAYDKIVRVEKILDEYASNIPKTVLAEIKSEVRELEETASREIKIRQAEIGLLGALATAGMAAIAFEHEFRRQLAELASVSDEIQAAGKKSASTPRLAQLAGKLKNWIARAESTRGAFTSLISEEDRSKRVRLRAKTVVEQIADRSEPFMRGIPIDTNEIDSELRLPPATLAEWTAIIQNVIVNAVNSMLDAPTKRMKVVSETRGRTRSINFLDTGSGVDLRSADELFEPFKRRSKISPDRARLGLGGTGLGLTIVKMVAENVGCEVAFIEPARPYKTAFRLSWRERE